MRVALRRLRAHPGQVAVVIVRPEIHIEDQQARNRVRLELRGLRAEQKVGPLDVAGQLGIGRSSFQRMELVTSWKAAAVQAWARVLGHRLIFDIRDLTVPYWDGDPTASVLAAMTTFGGLDEDQHHLHTVVNNLIRVRVEADLLVDDLARKMQVTYTAVRGWENLHEQTRVRTVQRYGRALGGSVGLTLAPVAVGVAA